MNTKVNLTVDLQIGAHQLLIGQQIMRLGIDGAEIKEVRCESNQPIAVIALIDEEKVNVDDLIEQIEAIEGVEQAYQPDEG